MRKIIVLFIIATLVLLIFAAGCAKEESGKKLASRPVQAKPIGDSAEVGSPMPAPDVQAPVAEPVVETRSVVAAGQADCEQLASTDIAAVLGGSWSKISDCPQRPSMPKGVDVCQCSYDGPKQVYVNVESQLYDDSSEAVRVYNMYCSGTAEESEVGTSSCRVPKTNDLRPNFVYFLKGNYFVKVSCLGGSCPMNSIAELAGKVDAKI